MDSVFLNLVRGNRLSNYMGLRMDEGYTHKFAQSYIYIEIPVKELYLPTEEKVVSKGLRNQQIQVIPACSIEVRGSHVVEVEPNRSLSEYGTVSGGTYRVHPGEGLMKPAFYITLRKDMEISDIEWSIRLYMIP